jgi:hypothetical protein
VKVDFAKARNVFPYAKCMHRGDLNPVIEQLQGKVVIRVYCGDCKKSCKVEVISSHLIQSGYTYMAQTEILPQDILRVQLFVLEDDSPAVPMIYSTSLLSNYQKWD